MKEVILDKLCDLVINFMYYDRKEDDNLPVGAIEEAIKKGEITVDDITKKFRSLISDDSKGV